MEYRQLGRSGLKVSVLTMGTMTMGGKGVFAAVGALLQRKAIKPIAGPQFKFREAPKAHELVMQNGRDVGKIVLVP